MEGMKEHVHLTPPPRLNRVGSGQRLWGNIELPAASEGRGCLSGVTYHIRRRNS